MESDKTTSSQVTVGDSAVQLLSTAMQVQTGKSICSQKQVADESHSSSGLWLIFILEPSTGSELDAPYELYWLVQWPSSQQGLSR